MATYELLMNTAYNMPNAQLSGFAQGGVRTFVFSRHHAKPPPVIGNLRATVRLQDIKNLRTFDLPR
jgi:hypothetical protein